MYNLMKLGIYETYLIYCFSIYIWTSMKIQPINKI